MFPLPGIITCTHSTPRGRWNNPFTRLPDDSSFLGRQQIQIFTSGNPNPFLLSCMIQGLLQVRQGDIKAPPVTAAAVPPFHPRGSLELSHIF